MKKLIGLALILFSCGGSTTESTPHGNNKKPVIISENENFRVYRVERYPEANSSGNCFIVESKHNGAGLSISCP
jgi:hypothetical protein